MAALPLTVAWAALDAVTSGFNVVAAHIHHAVELVVPDPLLSMALTTLLVSTVTASVLTAASLAIFVYVIQPLASSLFGRSGGGVSISRQPAPVPTAPAAAAIPKRSFVRRLLSLLPSRGPPKSEEIVLKLRVHGEGMWHRLVIDRAHVRNLPQLHASIRTKLAIAAMESDDNALQGFSVEDLAGAAKITRVLLVREGLVVGNDDVLALKPGDELEVQLKN